MTNQDRDPERILRRIKSEETDRSRGTLKIFFGYAAGVGKTYAMLEAAHAAQEQGVQVLAGYIEPHTRPETMALLKRLECLPTRLVQHGEIRLHEFDLDGALRRKPELILVDELAHTNAPGSRHNKRYQDIQELLQAGINVYTTINVQHIESLNDTVASITGIAVRERIPDSVFDSADQVEIVDIEPQELLERLQNGKIYGQQQAQRAMANFFTTPNLTALREIALRRCADRVGTRTEMTGMQREPYHTEEHILVCLSSSPSNGKIIRTAARMAQAFKGTFTALFVETPDFAAMSKENKQRLRGNIRLAEQLGAKIETVYGVDVPFQIAEFARLSGVSKIVIGRSAAARGGLFGKQTLTEKLIAIAPYLDIHIIPDASSQGGYRARKARRRKLDPADVLKTIGILILASCIGGIFDYVGFEESNIITVYVLGVLLTSVVTRDRVYSLCSSVISVLVFNFLFTDPRLSLRAYDTGYPVTFLVMFLAALLTSSLAAKLKEHASQSALVAYRNQILFDVNQALQQAQNRNDIIRVTALQLKRLLQRDVVMYPVVNGNLETAQLFYADPDAQPDGLYTTDRERTVALWVLKNNKHAGATTQTLSDARCLYLSIRINQKIYGVTGISVGNEPLDSAEKSMTLSILGECALALENEQNAREKEEAAMLAQKEQLQANLLRAISHDLRTPLTSISGNASNFLSNGNQMDGETKRQLFTDIYDDAMWLINLVENLLSVSRLEGNHLNLHFSSELVPDVIEEALKHINRRRVDYHITVQHEDDFLLAKMDAKLIVQVIINLVDNAIKYTPAGSHIAICTRPQNGKAEISVSDDGGGIPDDVKTKVFDMFYSGANRVADSRRSLGLGLSLCKTIVTAHGGTIWVSDQQPHGTVFTFTLPIEEVTLYE